MVVYAGELMPLVRAAELSGISLVVLQNRHRRGWPLDRMFLPKLMPHQRINARKL